MAVEQFSVVLSANFAEFEKKIAEAAANVGKIGDAALVVSGKLNKVAEALEKSTDSLAESTGKLTKASRANAKSMDKTSKSAKQATTITESFLGTIKELAFNLLKTGGVVFGIALLSLKLTGFNVTMKTLILTMKSGINIFAALAPAGLGKFANKLQIIVSSTEGFGKALGKLEKSFDLFSKSFFNKVERPLLRFGRFVGGNRGIGAVARSLKFLGAESRRVDKLTKATKAAEKAAKEAAKSFRSFGGAVGEGFTTAGRAASELSENLGKVGGAFTKAAEGEAAFLGETAQLAARGGAAAGIAGFLGTLIEGFDKIGAQMLGIAGTGGFGLLIMVGFLTNAIGNLSLAVGRKMVGALEKATAQFTIAQQEMFRFSTAVVGLDVAMKGNAGTVEEWTVFIDKIAASTAIMRRELLGASSVLIETSRNVGLTVDQMQELFVRVVDLSEASGRGLFDAVNSVSSALLGNITAAKNLGITLNKAVLLQSEYFLVLNKTWAQLTLNEQVQVRLAVLLEQSDAFIGAAANRTEEWVGAIQRLNNQWTLWNQQWGKTISTLLLPLVQGLNNILANLRTQNKLLGDFSAIMTGVGGVLLIAIGHLAKWSALIFGVIFGVRALSFAIGVLTKGQFNLTKVMRAFVFRASGVKKSAGLAAAGFALVGVAIKDTFRALGNIIKRFITFIATGGIFTKAINSVSSRILKLNITALISGKIFTGFIKGILNFAKALQFAIVSAGKFVFVTLKVIATKGILIAFFTALVTSIFSVIGAITGLGEGMTAFQTVSKLVISGLVKAFTALKVAASAAWTALKRVELLLSAFTSILKTGFLVVMALAVGAWQLFIATITEFLGTGDRIVAFFTDIGNSIANFASRMADIGRNFRTNLLRWAKDVKAFASELQRSSSVVERIFGAAALSAAVSMEKLAGVIGTTTVAIVEQGVEAEKTAASLGFFQKAQNSIIAFKESFVDASGDFISGLEQWREEFVKNGDKFIDVAKATAEGMSNAFSDFFFNSMIGKFNDLQDVARNALKAIARSISNQLGRKLTEETLRVSTPLLAKLTGIFKKKPGVEVEKAFQSELTGFVEGEEKKKRIAVLPKTEPIFTKELFAKAVEGLEEGLIKASVTAGEAFTTAIVAGAGIFIQALIDKVKEAIFGPPEPPPRLPITRRQTPEEIEALRFERRTGPRTTLSPEAMDEIEAGLERKPEFDIELPIGKALEESSQNLKTNVESSGVSFFDRVTTAGTLIAKDITSFFTGTEAQAGELEDTIIEFGTKMENAGNKIENITSAATKRAEEVATTITGAGSKFVEGVGTVLEKDAAFREKIFSTVNESIKGASLVFFEKVKEAGSFFLSLITGTEVEAAVIKRKGGETFSFAPRGLNNALVKMKDTVVNFDDTVRGAKVRMAEGAETFRAAGSRIATDITAGTVVAKEKIVEAGTAFKESILGTAQVTGEDGGAPLISPVSPVLQEATNQFTSSMQKAASTIIDEVEGANIGEKLTTSADKAVSGLSKLTGGLSSFIGKIGGLFGGATGGAVSAGAGLLGAISGGPKKGSFFGGGSFLGGFGGIGGIIGGVGKLFGFQEGGVANLQNIGGNALIARSPTTATISEKEPEVISPISKLRDMLGPTTINVNAIDSKSAAQWFSENKELVAGTLFSMKGSTSISKLTPFNSGPF